MTTLADFKALLNSTDKPIFVKYGAVWCFPCQQFAPIFMSVSKQTAGGVFVAVDIDAAEDIVLEYKITRIPVVKVFSKGIEIDQLSGSSESSLRKLVAKYF